MTNNKHKLKSVFAIKVYKFEGQEKIDELKEKELYDSSRHIISEEEYLWIPINSYIEGSKEKKLPRKLLFSNIEEKYGIKSFDIIGDLLVIHIPDELKRKEKEIAKNLMKAYPKVKAVYKEIGRTKGKLRIQKKQLIIGSGAETIHHEYGLKFKLNINKVFFSPRQSFERFELTKNILKGDNVCVFFSGIAPIPIYISKFTKAKKIVGIELNETAHQYALENLELNSAQNIKLINGDVNEWVSQIAHKERFDVIILPLPKHAPSYLDQSMKILEENGRVIIYVTGTISKCKEQEEELESKGFQILNIRKGSEIAPKEWRFTIHAKRIIV